MAVHEEDCDRLLYLNHALQDYRGAFDFMSDPRRAAFDLAVLFTVAATREKANECVDRICTHLPGHVFLLRLHGLLPAMAATIHQSVLHDEPTVFRALSLLVDADDANAVALTEAGVVRMAIDLVLTSERNVRVYSEVAEFLRSVFEVHRDAVLEGGSQTMEAVLELRRVLGSPAEELVDQVQGATGWHAEEGGVKDGNRCRMAS